RQALLTPQEFIEIIKSSYAKKVDLKLTDIRKKQIYRYQKSYLDLVRAVEKDTNMTLSQIFLELTMRSSVINKYDRVTGDSITYIVQKVQKLRPKLSAEEIYSLAKQFSTYQNLNPDNKFIPS